MKADEIRFDEMKSDQIKYVMAVLIGLIILITVFLLVLALCLM